MNEKNPSLLSGYYVGVRSNIRKFHFSLPKVAKALTDDVSMEEFFRSLNNGEKTRTTPVSNNTARTPSDEKTTLFSGWVPAENARNLSDKARSADLIYGAASEDSPEEVRNAKKRVADFKKGAAAVLGRCADTGETITQAIADEINRNECIVTEIKVVILCVSDTEVSGGRLDPKTGKWYSEKTLRKFYVFTRPSENLLSAFAKEIADPTTNVSYDGRLIAVRSDKVTFRTGRNYRESSFRIITSWDAGSENDEKVRTALERIRARMNT